ncbi:MAG TPA: hypothetical protein VHV32_16785 [Candidatus Angelobacter sp.]|jgi:hypothetical protein|nr:hypothetical protein [Candidatus Angelobacter sp.]
MLRRSAAFLLFFIALAGSSALLGQDFSRFDAKAFHRANDREWSAKTGLPPEDIRRLRLAAGIEDDEELNPIDWIDAKTLGHERILLVTAAGSGHCLTVAVYQPHGRSFRKLWSEYAMPDGGGFCHPSLCRDAEARAAKKNRIIVSVPAQAEGAEMGVCDENTILTFQGEKKTYVLTKTEHTAERCNADDYRRAISESLHPGDDSHRLVTVFAITNLPDEPTIAIEKTPNRIEVDRLTFREELWTHALSHWKSQTPSQCIAEAKSLPIDKTPMSISAGDARRLVDELNKIDRSADSCPRNANGTCAYILDGAVYRVAFPDGFIVQLQDVTGMKGLRSENAALLDWVHELMRYVRPQGNKPAH